MKNDSLISIIIPIFNGEKFLRQAVESLLNQNYPNLEIIIVNDGSTDGSEAIAKSFSNIRYIFQENQGNAGARNSGIKVANGKLLSFLDQDDLWAKNSLSKQVKFMSDNPEMDYCVGKTKFFLEPGIDPPKWFKLDLLEGEYIDKAPSTMMIKKEVFDKVGLYDENYSKTSDVEWIIQADRLSIVAGEFPHVVHFKRVHKHNQSGDNDYHKQLSKILFKKLHTKEK